MHITEIEQNEFIARNVTGSNLDIWDLTQDQKISHYEMYLKKTQLTKLKLFLISIVCLVRSKIYKFGIQLKIQQIGS